MKILANDGMANSGIEVLEKAGFEVSTTNIPQEELIAEINKQGIEVLLVRSATQVRKDIIDSCTGLKMIGRGGVGMDNIDVEYARANGKEVFNTPAASSQSVAELVMAHLFSSVRFLYDAYKEMPTNGSTDFKVLKKKYAKGIELRGKTMGIIGFGRIGQALAQYAIGCGMNVIVSDKKEGSVSTSLQVNGQTIEVVLERKSQEDLLANADFVSLHIPSTDKPIIGKKEFAQMKNGAIIINAARGGAVDEDALIENLNSGKIAHACLDVFVNEPNPRQDLLAHPKVSLSPHIGAATLEAQDRIGTELADQIIAYYSKVNA